ncbi:MAG: hypothetical protein NT013_02465 [Planctomycetia bacterium]|nr:hypothetical protein [Planctomycetia bacterium]
MKLFVRNSVAVLVFLIASSLPAESSAAELQVRLTDGRILRGSFVEKQSNAEQLAIEVRTAGSSIRRVLPWKQVALAKVLSQQEPYEPSSPVRPDMVRREVPIDSTSSNSEDSNVSEAARWPLFELIISAQPVSTLGKADWDALRLSLRGLDQNGQSVPLFGTLTVTLWGQRQEVVRADSDQIVTIPRQIEQLATWTRSLDSTVERIAGVAVPVGARQGRSGAVYEDASKHSWGVSSPDNYSQNVVNFTGRQGRGRAIYENDLPDTLQLMLALPQPLPDHDARRWPVGEVSVELLMPGVGVFSATSSGVVLAHQSSLRQHRLEHEGTRFFANEVTTDSIQRISQSR